MNSLYLTEFSYLTHPRLLYNYFHLAVISPRPTARTTHSTDGTRGPVPWTVSPPPPANPSAGEAPITPRPQSTGPRLPLTSSV